MNTRVQLKLKHRASRACFTPQKRARRLSSDKINLSLRPVLHCSLCVVSLIITTKVVSKNSPFSNTHGLHSSQGDQGPVGPPGTQGPRGIKVQSSSGDGSLSKWVVQNKLLWNRFAEIFQWSPTWSRPGLWHIGSPKFRYRYWRTVGWRLSWPPKSPPPPPQPLGCNIDAVFLSLDPLSIHTTHTDIVIRSWTFSFFFKSYNTHGFSLSKIVFDFSKLDVSARITHAIIILNCTLYPTCSA